MIGYYVNLYENELLCSEIARLLNLTLPKTEDKKTAEEFYPILKVCGLLGFDDKK